MKGAAGAIAARMQGDDYQARWFLRQALRLLDADSRVVRVALEHGQYPWFDDVVTFFEAGGRRERLIEAHQVKFHVVADGALTVDALMEAAFIGSKKHSIAQHVINIYRETHGAADSILVTPWQIDRRDLLAAMCETGRDGDLRLTRLFDGKERSDASSTRKRLLTHTGASEDDLRAALERFRIVNSPGLEFFRDLLDGHLGRHGFMTTGEAALANSYDDLVRKAIQRKELLFEKESFTQLLHDAGLKAAALEPRYRVGIRSFMRFAEHLDEFTDELLDLTPAFADRTLKPDESWSQLRDRVRTFMEGVDRARHALVELHIPCLNSIAYAAGYATSPKSGTRYLVSQPGVGGKAIWDLGAGENLGDTSWTIAERHLRDDRPDVAIAIGLARSIGADVEHFVQRHVDRVGKLIIAEPAGGAGQSAVQGGAHAIALAEKLDAILTERRTVEQRREPLHVFIAGPNGFTFAMGRTARRIARTTLYEFPFGKPDPDDYYPSISLESIR